MAGPRSPQRALLDDATVLSLAEFCRAGDVSVEIVVEMVEQGVIEPQGRQRADWRFSGAALRQARRALRLRRDLGLNWPGVALSLSLLEELTELRRRHRALLRRLDL